MVNRVWLAIIILLSISLSGCWGHAELSELGIVLATAVDFLEEEDQYEITVMAVMPTGGGGTGQQTDRSSTWIGSAKGMSPIVASNNLRKTAPKRLTWVQNDILIIGQDAARKGIDGIIDFFVRNRETRLTNRIIICEEKAQDLFLVPADIESNLYTEINGMIEGGMQWGRTYIPELREFLQDYSLAHMGAVAGRIGYIERNMVTFSTNREQYMQLTDPEGKQKIVNISGSTVFKNSKMVGFLNDTETRGYLWVTGKGKGNTLTVGDYDNKGMIAMETINSNSSIEPVISGDDISMKVKVDVTGRFAEKEGLLNLTDIDVIGKIEKVFQAKIAEEIEAAVQKAQKKYKTDIFGFGDTLYRKEPDIWKNVHDQWEKIFPEVEIQTEIKVLIRRLGETQSGIVPEEIE